MTSFLPESKAEKPEKKAEPQAHSAKKAPKTDTAPLEPINFAPKKSRKKVQKADDEDFVDVKEIVDQNNDYENYYINTSDKDARDRARARKKKKNDKKKKKNTAVKVILILLIIVLCAGIGVYWYVNNILEKMILLRRNIHEHWIDCP